MTTSGSYAFDPSFAALLDEAAERAGLDPQTLTHRHISSAKMSLNLMLTEWAAKDGDVLYRVATTTNTVSAAATTFALPTGALDIVDMVVEYNDSDEEVPMSRISRQDYLNIADKTLDGMPTKYYVDVATLNAPVVYLIPVPDQTCIFRYDYTRLVQTITGLAETFDVQRLWLEAVAAGLAERLAAKYNMARLSFLVPKAAESYALARRAGSGASQVTVSSRGFGSVRTRRRS